MKPEMYHVPLSVYRLIEPTKRFTVLDHVIDRQHNDLELVKKVEERERGEENDGEEEELYTTVNFVVVTKK